MAPEILPEAWIGPEVDIYSFGIVLYELAVAYKPNNLPNQKSEKGLVSFRKQDWRNQSRLL